MVRAHQGQSTSAQERGSLAPAYRDMILAHKDRAFRKKVDDVDDHGASCLGGPSEPGMLADVVGRVVSRPAVGSDCESGSKGFSARYTNRDGAIQQLPLLEEALMAVATSETRSDYGTGASAGTGTKGCGTGTSAERAADDPRISCGSEHRSTVLEPLRQEALTKVGASGGPWCAMQWNCR